MRAKRPIPSTALPSATEGTDIPWFIFTNRQRGSVVEASNITRAVAKWKKLNPKTDRGEIVAVIQGAGHFEAYGRIVQTPIFGMVVCVEQAWDKAENARKTAEGVSK